MFKISLKKIGRKRINCFRIIARDSKFRRDSNNAKYDLGYYKPQEKNNYIKINIDLYKKIIKNGGQPTKRVEKIFNIAKNFDNKTIICKKESEKKDSAIVK